MRITVVVALMLLCALQGFAGTIVSNLSGDVSVMQGKTRIAAYNGMYLKMNDEIRTGKNGQALIVVDERSQLHVAGNTRLKSVPAGQNIAFKLSEGWVHIKAKLSRKQRFVVRMPVCVASVRGTEFICSSKGNLIVLSGAVDFRGNNMARPIIVERGYRCFMPSTGITESTRRITPEEFANLKRDWELPDSLDVFSDTDDSEPLTFDHRVIPEPQTRILEEASPTHP
jgi:hypothetical protein